MKHFPFYILLFFFSVVVTAAERFPIAETLEPYIKNGELPGAVMVIATKDAVLQIDALGFADIEAKRAMTADSMFWLASQTKSFTAVAVMLLVDEGKLSLTEPLTTYLPELKDLKVVAEKTDKHTVLVPVNQPITLAMLLSHTAGFEFQTPFHAKHGIDPLPLASFITTAVMTPLRTQPGTAFFYSNIGIDLAGAVVERVSGMPFEEFMDKRLFEPLGMTDTTFFPNAEQLTRLATTYTFDKEQSKLVPTRTVRLSFPLDGTNRFAMPCGGLFSTPNDLPKFLQMMLGNGEFNGKRILSEAAVREIRTKQTGDLQTPYTQGLGFVLYGEDAFGIGGALATNFRANTQTGRVMLFFIQAQGLPKCVEAIDKFYTIGNRP